MRHLPEKLTSIDHPLVRNAYLKTKHNNKNGDTDILVIEARSKNKFIPEDLLIDLMPIQYIAEKEVGHIDEIDIVLN